MGVRDWGSGIRQAAGFAWSAVKRGLTEATGYIQYARGGGPSTIEEWGTAFRTALALEKWEPRVEDYGPDDIISRRAFGPAIYNYSEQYNIRHLVRWFDPSTDKWREQSIQVMSGELLSRRDWEAAVAEWLEDYDKRGQYDPGRGYEILEYEAMEVF